MIVIPGRRISDFQDDKLCSCNDQNDQELELTMIGKDHVRAMALYNKWMNDKIYACAAQLTDEGRKRDRGAFFKSIHATLNHILWGDQIWLHRLAGTPKPQAGSISESVA